MRQPTRLRSAGSRSATELVRRTAPGQSVSKMNDGFSSFFDRETKGQVQRATLLLGSVDEANDVVQEAMTRLYERWDSISEPGPYLNRTALNLCRDRGRRQSVHTRVVSELSSQRLETDRSGALSPDSADGPEVLDDVLAELPFNQRAAVVLRYWGGLSFAEISSELECSPGSVGPWINRALATIRKVVS